MTLQKSSTHIGTGAVPATPLVRLLPDKPAVAFCDGAVIYEGTDPNAVYMVVSGMVKLAAVLASGERVVLDLLQPGGIFGEVSILGQSRFTIRASANKSTSVRKWSGEEIEHAIMHEPSLGVHLVRMLVAKLDRRDMRLQSFAVDDVLRRLALALQELASRPENAAGRSLSKIPPITQLVLSQYIGTSREQVNNNMAKLKNLGIIDHSRQHITVDTTKMQRFLVEYSPAV